MVNLPEHASSDFVGELSDLIIGKFHDAAAASVLARRASRRAAQTRVEVRVEVSVVEVRVVELGCACPFPPTLLSGSWARLQTD
eukprot:scaffold3577_cov63-Phaeocystis_antarctica.AAC.3